MKITLTAVLIVLGISANLAGQVTSPNSTAGDPTATSLGYKDTAANYESLALGCQNQATSDRAIAIGTKNSAIGANSLCVGYENIGAGGEALILGLKNNIAANCYQCSAIGFENDVTGNYNLAFGENNSFLGGNYSMAFGRDNSLNGQEVSCVGIANSATALEATAIGHYCTASAKESIAFGYKSSANSSYSVAFGWQSNAAAQSASAIGKGDNANGEFSTAVGYQNTATGLFSSAFGSNLTNSIPNSVMIGPSATAKITILQAATTGGIALVGIGTTNPTYPLAVNGTIEATEVLVKTGWSDYVFDKNYRLAPLSEVEEHIKADGHLPGIPSASEVTAKGISIGDIQARLLAKIEELTLHQIEQEKRLDEQAKEIDTLKKQNAALR